VFWLESFFEKRHFRLNFRIISEKELDSDIFSETASSDLLPTGLSDYQEKYDPQKKGKTGS